MSTSEKEATDTKENPQLSQVIKNIVDMGYEEEQVKLALTACSNDPEKAIQYLFTKTAQHGLEGPFVSAHEKSYDLSSVEGKLQSQIEESDQSNLFYEKLTLIRETVRQNPQLLNSILQDISTSNPQLLNFIVNSKDAFTGIFNEPVEGEISILSILPDSIIHLILRYLNFSDLFVTQFVSEKWKTVCQDKKLWEKMEFKISKGMETATVEHMLQNMSMIQKISTVGKHSVPLHYLFIILESVVNITKLKCKFFPPLLFEHVQQIFEKYPNLESLELDSSDNNILESVTLLLNIKNIFICKQGKISNWNFPHNFINIYKQVCGTLGQFQELNTLDISGLYLETDDLNEDFVLLLTKKGLQLHSLIVGLRNSEMCLNTVSNCINLMQLDIVIYFRAICDFSFNILSLIKLNSLSLAIHYNGRPINLINNLGLFFHRFIDMNFNVHTVLHLQFLKLSLEFYQIDGESVLKKIIVSCPSLKVLKLKFEIFSTVSDELTDIEKLSKLEEFSLSCINRLTLAGIESISYCSSLQHIKLKQCITFTLGSNKKQQRRIDEIIALIRSLRKLKTLVFKSSFFQQLNNNMRTMVMNECVTKGVTLKIL